IRFHSRRWWSFQMCDRRTKQHSRMTHTVADVGDHEIIRNVIRKRCVPAVDSIWAKPSCECRHPFAPGLTSWIQQSLKLARSAVVTRRLHSGWLSPRNEREPPETT